MTRIAREKSAARGCGVEVEIAEQQSHPPRYLGGYADPDSETASLVYRPPPLFQIIFWSHASVFLAHSPKSNDSTLPHAGHG